MRQNLVSAVNADMLILAQGRLLRRCAWEHADSWPPQDMSCVTGPHANTMYPWTRLIHRVAAYAYFRSQSHLRPANTPGVDFCAFAHLMHRVAAWSMGTSLRTTCHALAGRHAL